MYIYFKYPDHRNHTNQYISVPNILTLKRRESSFCRKLCPKCALYMYAVTQNWVHYLSTLDYFCCLLQHILVEAETPDFLLDESEMVPVSLAQPIFENNMIYVIPAESAKDSEISGAVIGDKIHRTVSYKSAFVDMLFACTYYKAQGLCLRGKHWKVLLS